jgi:hypothetical protein
MNEPGQPEVKPEVKSQATFQARSTVVPTIPADMAYPLREDEYQTLCDGASGADRASRDLCIGLFVGTMVGIIGVLATVDWQIFWAQKHIGLLFWLGILLFIAAVAAAGCAFYWRQMYRKDTSRSRLKVRISEFFAADQ